MSELRGRDVKRIFFPEGAEEGGWWWIMKAAYELANTPIVNPDRKEEVMKETGITEVDDEGMALTKGSFECPHCAEPIFFTVELNGKKTYMAVLQTRGDGVCRVGQTRFVSESGRAKFKNKKEMDFVANTERGCRFSIKMKNGRGVLGMGTIRKRRENGSRRFTLEEKGKWPMEDGLEL